MAQLKLHRWTGEKEGDGQRKCISQTGPSDDVSLLSWETGTMEVTRLEETTKEGGTGGEKG